MPEFQLDLLITRLRLFGINCSRGDLLQNVRVEKRPYFERWLGNKDGFVQISRSNIDYIGVEDIVRMGPFFNIYCLIQNDHLIENDNNCHRLLHADPYYDLHNGKITKLGWSGGVLAEFLTKDPVLNSSFSKNIMGQEVRTVSVKVANFACIIQSRIWDVDGFIAIYEVIDRIGLHVRRLLSQIHFGDDLHC